MYRLTFAQPVASESFQQLPREAQLRFNDAFELVAGHPRTSGQELDVHQLRGYQYVWTLRVPPRLAVYAIDGNEVVLIIFGHRRDVYARFHGLLPPEGRYVARRAAGRVRG